MIRIVNEGAYGREVGNGYLYILKHGLGGGVLPRDVEILKTVDLDNGFTAIWIDRPLERDELDEYDIPSETQLNVYKKRSNFDKYVK